MKPLEEKKPSCDIRKPTLRGGRSATGGSTRSSSSFLSATMEAYIRKPFLV
jgi:hypothetical protein